MLLAMQYFNWYFDLRSRKKLWLKKKKGEPAWDWGSGTGSGWPPAGRKPWFWLKYIISLSFHKIIPDHHEREHVEADVVVPLARVQVTSGRENFFNGGKKWKMRKISQVTYSIIDILKNCIMKRYIFSLPHESRKYDSQLFGEGVFRNWVVQF